MSYVSVFGSFVHRSCFMDLFRMDYGRDDIDGSPCLSFTFRDGIYPEFSGCPHGVNVLRFSSLSLRNRVIRRIVVMCHSSRYSCSLGLSGLDWQRQLFDIRSYLSSLALDGGYVVSV